MTRQHTKRKTVLTISYLKSRGWPQADIAAHVKLSPSTISRILQHEALEYLEMTAPKFRWDKVDDQDRQELEGLDDDRKAADDLAKILRIGPEKEGPVVTVASIAGTGSQSTDAGLETFCARIAPRIQQLLLSAGIIGVTWGRVVSKLCDCLAQQPSGKAQRRAKQTRVIPLCGESLGATHPSSLSSSHLAERLETILTVRSGQEEFLSLGMIPVFFPGPAAFNSAELRAARKLLRYSVAYARIFGVENRRRGGSAAGVTERPLAERLDAVLTSVSRQGNPFGFGERDDFTWKTLELAELERLLVGDLGGVPLPRPELSTKDIQKLNVLYDRWTGLKQAHLRECARRAFRQQGGGAPGVIVVGYGEERAKCVIEAIKLGLVNHLVIDSSLREAIALECGSI